MAEKETYNSVNPFPEMEETALSFWQKADIFNKSLTKESPQGDYVFYDGPPFATGTPHYGHIVASVMKDVIPRYWTMKGYHVDRKWGWDCHGLPIENIVEKELNFKSKKEIEKLGIEKFNDSCRARVLEYVDEWRTVITRLGRWADMDHAYKTMDKDYMESIWWVFKELWDKGLIYKDYRSLHICPRCETTLSQSEVTEGYKDIKDLSCIAKFELIDEPGTFVLAWTTTPWTLIGNVALAVGEKIEYVKIENEGGEYILAKELLEKAIKSEYKVIAELKGADLINKSYKPLFPYYADDEKLVNRENGWKIYGADFVTTEEGTGIVHIAPAFGEDDMSLGKKNSLPFVQHVAMDGKIKEEANDFAYLNVKPEGDHMKTDVEIIKYLAAKGLLFSKEKYEHSYPHCWRCDTPLLNYATSSWFVNITKIKDDLLKNAKGINWQPAHMKEGRFGNWLEGARDWSISRQRFWASTMPIWECACGERQVIGSIAELEELSGQKVEDLHKHVVDRVVFKCSKCQGEMKRIPDVLDCWFESGSMPYAQLHYPFENKEKLENSFPAEFIAEGADQTRAWFYYLHAISVGIRQSQAYKNVIVNGIVLAEDGKKMSKRLKNYPDPTLLFSKYSADALRYYLLNSPVMMAENMNFSEEGVKESLRKTEMLLWNVYKFYAMYANEKVDANNLTSSNVLDQWILARLEETNIEITKQLDAYDLPRATKPIAAFIDDFSTWYLRRSRDRFKSADSVDKQNALATTKYVLLNFSKIIAPTLPFLAENLWQRANGFDFQDDNKSVHLEAWPKLNSKLLDQKVIIDMEAAKKAVEAILAARDVIKQKIRQPLAAAVITYNLDREYRQIIEEECNIKKVISESEGYKPEGISWQQFGESLYINTEITPELSLEGAKREIVRTINALRKKFDLDINDRIAIFWHSDDAEVLEALKLYQNDIMADTLADTLTFQADLKGEEIRINKGNIILHITKIN